MPSGVYLRTEKHNQKVSQGLRRAYKEKRRVNTLTKVISSRGGKSTFKKYGQRHYLKLGELARKTRMTDRTKELLRAWKLPMKGTIKKRLRPYGWEITWAYKYKGKFHYKYLGRGTVDKFPKH